MHDAGTGNGITNRKNEMAGGDIKLPDDRGRLNQYALKDKPLIAPERGVKFNRIALSAAHVVCDPFSQTDPSGPATIDWEATLRFRRYILDCGLDIAEAMDTAQRGMGLDAAGAMELVRRTMSMVAPDERDRVFSGVSTDSLDLGADLSLDQIEAAYMDQMESVEKAGSGIIVMASPALARVAQSKDDYVRVYGRILSAASKPIVLHWLGAMFDPRLCGYWGGSDFKETSETVLAIIRENESKIDGIKLSLLDEAAEVSLRKRLPGDVRMYTGDDFNYPALIAGDGEHYSDALLGIFDAIAPAAAGALAALAKGDKKSYDEILAPTVPLSRLLFRAPTQYYKTGIVFLAWLNGHQDHFVMLNGAQAMRSLGYFVDVFKFADEAGLLRNPDMACERMTHFLRLYGVE